MQKEDDVRPPLSRVVLRLGAIGIPVLFSGLITLDLRACLAGAAISGTAAVLHAVLSLR